MEPERHEEFGHDDPDDEDEGDVEDDLGGDAPDGVGVDGADCDDFDQTFAELAVAEAGEEIRYVRAADLCVERSIAEVVKDRGIVDLGGVQPCQ